jgi:Fe2+ or Zn2+ uptake regulation protein
MPEIAHVDRVTATASDDPRELVELLHGRGQRVTPQRLVILRELRRLGRHATAEEVHRAIDDELPGIAAPTVYATLELLVELGFARRINTGSAAVYDAGMQPHQHAVCRRCGRVQDIAGSVNADALVTAARREGFKADGAELIISGLCADCARESQ